MDGAEGELQRHEVARGEPGSFPHLADAQQHERGNQLLLHVPARCEIDDRGGGHVRRCRDGPLRRLRRAWTGASAPQFVTEVGID